VCQLRHIDRGSHTSWKARESRGFFSEFLRTWKVPEKSWNFLIVREWLVGIYNDHYKMVV